MPSIYLTAEHERFRESVRRFMEEEIAPRADEWEAARRIPRAAWRRLGEMGFLGIHLPETYGGSGADIFYSMVFLEELARSRMGGFSAAVSVQAYIATGAISHQGSDAQRRKYLTGSIEGRLVGALAISEPDTGSDVAAIRARATRDGDAYVVSGRKVWITNGVEGDFYVVACKTDPDAGAGGITLLIVDADTPGIRTRRLDKIGWHSSDTAEVAFEEVRVPVAQRVGDEGAGFAYIMQTFVLERLATAAGAVGTATLALETTLCYMREREAFGKPIARFQALRHRVADLAAETEAARQLLYHAAWLYERGEPAVSEAAMAKLVATELAKRVVDECVQLYGGAGYVEEFPMARFYRDVRALPIVAGTSEIMREIIARVVVDGARFPGAREWAPARGAGGDVPTRGAPPDIENGAAPPAAHHPADATAIQSAAEHGAPTDMPPSVEMPHTIAGVMRALPSHMRADRTVGWRCRFHFRFGESDHPAWTVVVDGPSCTVAEGHTGTPDCIVTTSAATFIDIATGKHSPQTAFLMGRVKVSSLGEMMRFMKAFPPLRDSRTAP
ncbi:MAG TPA: acyl-CoA dehydrogenase family protein [Gemmatimonadaceae bacterium]|nr:acyl-CoA dehydrogenase family protein [Gemmatimonadaceae bacterium]